MMHAGGPLMELVVGRRMAIASPRGIIAPSGSCSAEANVKQMTEQVAQAKEAVQRARITADQKELQLREREGRILDIRARLNTCSSNREYQTCLEQIAADEQANSVLSDEILELFDKITSLQNAAEVAAKNLAKATADLAATRQRVAEEQTVVEAEMARVSDLLTQAEANLPGSFKPDYQRLVRSRGEDAMAPVEDECCGGCYQMITPQMLNELMLAQPVFCNSCGRLLYLPENREPKRSADD